MANKDYSSIYDIKQFAMKELAPKYFNTDEVNDLNIGLLGFVSEFIGTATEDSFNAVSVYMNEMFPHLAKLPETIYNNATLFQLDGSLAVPSKCTFYIFISENILRQHEANTKKPSNTTGDIYNFYLDSDMVIDVEGLRFKPDYDILISYRQDPRTGTNIYNAEYVFNKHDTDYKNTLSDIIRTNIRIKRVSFDGSDYIQLEVQCHQIEKFTLEETITFNDVITTPRIIVPFDGKLANFEVFYKAPEDANYIQLSKRLFGTPPVENKFCYYKMVDEGELELSFTTRDGYFQPEYNGELLVEYYTTAGADGNFETYTGSETAVYASSEVYQYNNALTIYAVPVSSAIDGRDSLPINQLQAETVELHSTVGSYTNENDLQIYFDNYNNTHNSRILFLKTRDDIFERRFSAYSLFKDEGNEILSTNTLDLIGLNDDSDSNDEENSSDFDATFEQSNILILKPGHIFTYNDNKYVLKERIDAGTNPDNKKYQYALIDESNTKITISGIERVTITKDDTIVEISEFAYNPYLNVLQLTESTIDDNDGGIITIYQSQYGNSIILRNKDKLISSHDSPLNSMTDEFIYTNPFLLYYKKNPTALGYYLNSVDSTHRLSSVGRENENNLNHVSQFVCSNLRVTRNAISGENKDRYTISVIVTPTSAPQTTMLKEPDPSRPDSKYESFVKLKLFFTDNKGNNRCWIEMEFDADNFDDTNKIYRYTCTVETDDMINDEEYFYLKGNDINTPYDDRNHNYINIYDVPGYADYYSESYGCPIPMNNSIIKIYTYYDAENAGNKKITHLMSAVDEDGNPAPVMNDSHLTNIYSTELDPVSFITPLEMINSVGLNNYIGGGVLNPTTGEIVDDTSTNPPKLKHHAIDIRSFPLVKAQSMVNPTTAMNFYNVIRAETKYLSDAIDKLTNNFSIDIKFYNTYGRSKNFFIDKSLDNSVDLENIDRVNISMKLQMNISYGLDYVETMGELKQFIKNYIEGINDRGSNSIYMSNLIRELENNFSYINYIKFVGIDDYGCQVQSIENLTVDLSTLSKAERVRYIPEYLTLAIDDIEIELI